MGERNERLVVIPGDNRVTLFQHCANCVTVVKDGVQATILDTGELIAFGWTKEGLQIQCHGCGTVLLDLDFEGRQIKWYEA